MPLELVFLEFETPYHVGWRSLKTLIDHVTVLRALANIAYETGLNNLVEAIKSCSIEATAILPALKQVDGYYRLIAPIPPLPSVVGRKRLGVEWATLEALKEITVKARECVSNNAYPFVDKPFGKDYIEIKCITEKGETISQPLKLYILKVFNRPVNVIDTNSGTITEPIVFEHVVGYRNRIDRLTGAADPFYIRGVYTPNTMWIAFKSSDTGTLKNIVNLLKLLGEIGIGAYRSRGWGKFRVVVKHVKEEDIRVLQNSRWTTNSYNLLLGSMLPDKGSIDTSKSFTKLSRIEGLSGYPHIHYYLPVLNVIDVGSLVYAINGSKTRLISINSSISGFTPFMVFNPIAIGV